MKIPFLPVHIIRTRILDAMIKEAKAVSYYATNRQMAHLLDENIKMKAIIDSNRLLKGRK